MVGASPVDRFLCPLSGDEESTGEGVFLRHTPSPRGAARTLILGLGNPLRRDDGIGCRLVQALSRRQLPPGVQALDGGAAGLGLLDLLEGWERVVVVDAAEMGREPGEFVRFTLQEVLLAGRAGGFSFHEAGLADVLGLAEALGHCLPAMVIFGVQPLEVDWGEGLSPQLEAILPALIDVVLEEVS